MKITGAMKPSALCLLLVLMLHSARGFSSAAHPAKSSVSINRHFQGDIFTPMGGDCSDPHCSPAGTNRSTSRPMRWGSCQCQCSAQKPIYRDDTKDCVDTVEECMLADYVNGAQSEKVPFVFMPVKGQLINANAEIALSDVRAEGQVVVSPVCVVSKAHYLTSSGWMPTDNSSSLDDEPPFALFRDSGRTYLQWLGESRLRSLLEGRVVLVKLLCKDTANARIGVFSPCIAFRVAGSPGLSDTKSEGEMSLHLPGLDASKDSKKSGLRNTDYLAIGISAGLLGLLYVAVLVVFLCYRRRRRRQNVHVKLTAPASPLIEQGTIRMNPLLHSRPTLPSGSAMFTQQQQQPADGSRRHSATPVVHPRMDYRLNSPEQMADRHYYGRGNVTVEMNPASVDAQKRIFFSPTYFDPELFKQAPPPGAVEFLSRIRGMIDTAKGKMTSRRFIPNLIDIPEEHGGYGYGYGYGGYGSAYGSGNLGHQPAGFDYGHHESIYDTMKRQMASIKKSVGRRSSDEPSSGQSVEYRSGRDTDEDQVEFRPTVNQKSPLPVRGGKNADSAPSGVAMYTNPSIEEIYKSLARESHPSAESSPKSSKNEDKIQPNVKKIPADDAVAELVSEAESKVPKVSSDDSDGIQYAPSAGRKVESVRYEQDSLDRSEFRLPGTRQHLYVKKKIRKSAQSNRLRSDPPAESKAAEEIGFVEGYNSSTNTSIKSLSRVLPAEEEMEIGNQLFNKNTGAKTLPRLLKMRRDGAIPEEGSRSGETESAESTRSSTSGETVVTAKPPIPKDNKKKSGRIDGLVNRRITVPVNAEIHQSDTQSDPVRSKLTIQVDDQPSVPLTVRTDDSFDADTLEKNQFRTKRIERQESFIDSLERPRTGKIAHSPSSSSGLGSSESSISPRNDPADAKPNSVTPGTVLNLCQIYTAKIERNSWGLQLNDPGAPKKPMKIVSASNPDVQLPKVHGTSAEPPPRPPKKETTPAPPLVPDRLLKPAANPPKLPPRNEEVSRTKVAVLPPLPPKNAQGRSTGKTEADQPSTSAPSLASHPHGTAAPVKQVEKTYNCGQFIMTNQESTSGSSGSSPVSGRNQTLGRKSSTNVLQRIAEIEREEVASGRRIDGVNGSVDTGAMTKGMEIALALRAKMDLEGTLKDNKKSRSIKKTWRKLMDKMEDSCSENEIVSAVSASASAASSIAGTLRLAAKRKKNGLGANSSGKNSAKVNASESDETDSESRSSSLGSDGTGHPDPVEHSSGGVKLKGFYKFRSEDETPESKLVKKSADAPYGRIVRPLNKNRLKTMRRIDDSFDSGLYSSNYSTYQTSIGDY